MLRAFLVSAIAMATGLFQQAKAPAPPEVDQQAPAFTLPNTDNKSVSLKDHSGKFVVLEWTNHDCPIVKKHYDSGNMQQTQAWAMKNGVVWLSIVSSAPGKQGFVDGPTAKQIIKEKGHMISDMLLDPSGTVGKLYHAKTTPHMFVIDPKGKLIFMGGIDDKPGTNKADIPGARNHVREALKEALAGKPVSVKFAAPYGCSVKYAD